MKKYILAVIYMLIGVIIWGLFIMPIVSKIAGAPLDVFIELIFVIVLLYVVMNILKIGKREKKS